MNYSLSKKKAQATFSNLKSELQKSLESCTLSIKNKDWRKRQIKYRLNMYYAWHRSTRVIWAKYRFFFWNSKYRFLMSRHFSGFELESPEPRGRQMVSGTRIGRALLFFFLWAWPMYASPCWARSLRHICLELGPLVSRVQCGRPARPRLGPGLLRSMPIFIAITYYKTKRKSYDMPSSSSCKNFWGASRCNDAWC